MKKQLLISMLFVIVALTSCSKDGDFISEGMSDGSTRTGGITIPDIVFRSFLLNNPQINTNGDNYISNEEALKVRTINCNNLSIKSLLGIEYFLNLEYLSCSSNQLACLHVSENTKLEILYCQNNQLTCIEVLGNVELLDLYCYNNKLTHLDLSGNAKLALLQCMDNQLTTLDVSYNADLEFLDCTPMEIEPLATLTLYIGQEIPNIYPIRNPEFIHEDTDTIRIIGNITIPDANFKAHLVNRTTPSSGGPPWLGKIDTNNDGEISRAEALEVIYIDCGSLNIESLAGIEYFTNLDYLDCSHNQLTSIDISKNTGLGHLNCSNNQLDSIDVSKNLILPQFSCSNNQLTSIDVSKNIRLKSFSCNNNQLTNLDVSKNTDLRSLNCYTNRLTNLDVSKNTNLSYLDCSPMTISLDRLYVHANQSIPNVTVNRNVNNIPANTNIMGFSNNINIPDANFKAYLLGRTGSSNGHPFERKIDTNNDGEISEAEALLVEFINCSSKNISSLEGIEHFINLRVFQCNNNQITSIDLSGKTNLSSFSCSNNNRLTSINVNGCTSLTSLNCTNNNQLTSLSVTQCASLRSVNCSNNRLTSFNVNSRSLTSLDCSNNRLTRFYVDGCYDLATLKCYGNQVRNFDLMMQTKVTYLDCSPMPTLETVVLRKDYHSIPNVTYNRSDDYIPAHTRIVIAQI